MTAKELADWLTSPAGPETGPFNREEDDKRIEQIASILRGDTMNDLEYVRDMLARTNMRYSITVTNEITIITVNGSRKESPLRAPTVTLEFFPDGSFQYARND